MIDATTLLSDIPATLTVRDAQDLLDLYADACAAADAADRAAAGALCEDRHAAFAMLDAAEQRRRDLRNVLVARITR